MNISLSQIENVTRLGVCKIKGMQCKGGEFFSVRYNSSLEPQKKKHHVTTFFPSLILSSIGQIDELCGVSEKIESFLLTEQRDSGAYNYWKAGSEMNKKFAYPDDLDCTLSAYYALHLFSKKNITGKVLANIVSLLTRFETEAGGPYRTWIVDDKGGKWSDVDLAVNANIGYFLFLQDVHLKGLNNFFDKNIREGTLTSQYYFSDVSVLYFLSRFYKGREIDVLRRIVRKKILEQDYENVLEAGLLVSCALSLGLQNKCVKKPVCYLLKHYSNMCKPYPFVVEKVQKNSSEVSGCSAFTCAVCIEALLQYKEKYLVKQLHSQSKKRQAHKRSNSFSDDVYLSVRNRFKTFTPDFQKQMSSVLQKVEAIEERTPIGGLPYMFCESLGVQGETIDKTMLLDLGQANVFGWIAYTVYDDFLDDEGDVRLLSCANVALREVTVLFSKVLGFESSFFDKFGKIMDRIESANHWEVEKCRVTIEDGFMNLDEYQVPCYRDYTVLADRSFGHALGPIAVMFALGYRQNDVEMKALMEFYKHFLIARQLNDDAHDWEDDLKAGRVNPVCASVVEKYKIRYKRLEKVSFEKDRELFRKIFWFEVACEMCSVIRLHLNKARKALQSIAVVADTSFFDRCLDVLLQSTLEAEQEQRKTVDFLRCYK